MELFRTYFKTANIPNSSETDYHREEGRDTGRTPKIRKNQFD